MKRIPYYSPEMGRDAPRPESQAAVEIVDLLQSEKLHDLATAGLITYGMVRPNIGPDSNLLHLPDSEAAEIVEEQISGLGVVAKFSFTMDDLGVEGLYGGDPKLQQQAVPPSRNGGHANRWEEFKSIMISGPATGLVLYGDNAIERWRDHLGHWNIEKFRDPNTIRGRLATDNYNNLVHGSDSILSAKRELLLIADCIKRQYDGAASATK